VIGVVACYREYKLTFGETTKFGDLTFSEVEFGKMTTVGEITFGELTFGEMAFDDLTFAEMTSKTPDAKKSQHCTVLLLLCRSKLGLHALTMIAGHNK